MDINKRGVAQLVERPLRTQTVASAVSIDVYLSLT